MRRTDLIKLRDKEIVNTFHELYNIKRLRLDDALQLLSDKFFLSSEYIYKRIFYTKENAKYYHSLANCTSNK